MSQNPQNLYEAHVFGEYYANAGGTKSIKNYKLEIRVTEQMLKSGVLSVIKNSILHDALKAKYADYRRFRTHDIDKVIDLRTGKPVVQLPLMNHSQLTKLVEKKGLPIKISLYPKAPELRQAIRDCLDNREAFLQAQSKRKAIHGDLIAHKHTIQELNAGLMNGVDNEPVLVSETTPQQPTLDTDDIYNFDAATDVEPPITVNGQPVDIDYTEVLTGERSPEEELLAGLANEL